VLRDIMSREPEEYGGNPALKLPALRAQDGVWFGALNICRELARRSPSPPRVVWPEQLETPLLANAQELVVQAMTTEVGLIMGKAAGATDENTHHVKMRDSLRGSLAWLEQHLPEILAALPPSRTLSYLEICLFCLLTPLEFREILSVSGYERLSDFARRFGARASAVATPYHFDA
jgi:glutathione S-transferase